MLQTKYIYYTIERLITMVNSVNINKLQCAFIISYFIYNTCINSHNAKKLINSVKERKNVTFLYQHLITQKLHALHDVQPTVSNTEGWCD